MRKNMEEYKKVIQNNLYILKFAYKTVPWYVILMCLIPVAHAILQFFEFRYMTKFMVDSIQFSRPLIYVLFYLIAVFLGSALWLLGDDLFRGLYQKKGKVKLEKELRLYVYKKAAAMDLSCYDNPDFYNDFVWSINESSKRADAVLVTLADFSRNTAVILTSGLFIVMYNITGIFFVAASFILTFVVNTKINKLRFDLDVKMQPIQRRRDYISRVFYLNDFSKEIRLSNVKGLLYKDFKSSNEKLKETVEKHSKKLFILTFLSQFVFNSFIINGLYVIYLVFMAVVSKTISYGSVFALLQTSWSVKNGLNNLSNAIPQFQQHSLYIEKLRNFIDYKSKVVSPPNANTMAKGLSTFDLKNVGFCYDNSKPVLKNINMTIKPGEKIAIIGYNGAGKSTLIKLLTRLYDVTEGEIRYDGINIKNYNLDEYRNIFGSVFQDYQLFAASLAENIAMNNSEIKCSKLEAALAQVGFDKRLSSLEKGIDTAITREFDDDGVSLSGGEAQKIAIARVLYKDCNVIILDEPSSALDPISEYHLNETIINAARNKTVIFISHRLSTTRIADRIYMLENGEIVEEGNHEELMERNGKYAYMFNLQAEKYCIAKSIEEAG